MSGAAKPRRAVDASDLPEAPFAEVLLYGLTLGEEDPALGVLRVVRDQVAVIASLAECATPGTDFDISDLAPVLENVGRRLDVAIELVSRSRRGTTQTEPAPPPDRETEGAS